jgi:MFS family permease
MFSRQFRGADRLALLSLSGAYALRMLGLYLVLPVLSPYAAGLPGGATFWVGMAVGSYAFAQTAFQIPFGWLSDQWGRRRTIVVGLLLFAAGSVVAAEATTAPLLVLGRVLQGVGAISSVVVALVGDIARPEIRQRAMSTLGVVIGVAFGIGLTVGPWLAVQLSVPGVFRLCAILAVLSAAAVLLFVPSRNAGEHHPRPTFRETLGVFRDPSLLRINMAMLALHLGLTALFVVLPIQVERLVPREEMWRVLAPAIVVGLALLGLTAELVDRHHAEKPALLAGGVLLAAGALLLRSGWDTIGGMTLGLVVFVAGFAVVEPILPSLVTHYAAPNVRGTAAGAFSMSQFFGGGVGGLAGAFFLARREVDLFWLAAALGAVIALLALGLRPARTAPAP